MKLFILVIVIVILLSCRSRRSARNRCDECGYPRYYHHPLCYYHGKDKDELC